MSPERGRQIGASILAVCALAWVLGRLSGYDPVADVHPGLASQGPALAHLLGTDHLGRDVLARLALGADAFVIPGFVAAFGSVLLGLPAGALSGLSGPSGSVATPFAAALAGLARMGLSVIASIPGFVWVLLAATILGSDPLVLAGAVGLSYAPALAGEVHARIESLRRAEFVIALRAHGVSEPSILLRHLLWLNARTLVLRHAVQVFAFYLAVETTLSYIGSFGVAEPRPSWGNMLAFSFGQTLNPLAALAPALALWATSLGLALVAASLRDPSQREPGDPSEPNVSEEGARP